MSRYEHGTREPNLRTAFASEIISGVPAHKLFSGIYEEVEQEVTQRARIFWERLEKSRGNRLVWYKRKLLDALQSRKDAPPAKAT